MKGRGFCKNIFERMSIGGTRLREGFSLPGLAVPAVATPGLVGDVKDVNYSDLSGQASFTLFTLPTKATLIYCSIQIVTAFDVLLDMYVGLVDGTKFTSDTPSQPIGIMDYQFVKNAYTYSDTVAIVVSMYPTAGGAFPVLAVGKAKVTYLYVIQVS